MWQLKEKVIIIIKLNKYIYYQNKIFNFLNWDSSHFKGYMEDQREFLKLLKKFLKNSENIYRVKRYSKISRKKLKTWRFFFMKIGDFIKREKKN